MLINHIFLWIAFCTYVRQIEGGGCGAWTGTLSSTNVLNGNEDTTNTNFEVKLFSYSTSCACGVVTKWRIFARKAGTVILYVLNGNEVKGKTSINVPALSLDNYFEYPLSSEMFLSISSGNTLGFFTASPMITWDSGTSSSFLSSGVSERVVGASGTFATATTNRLYAVAAYIETGHYPMIINAPFTKTMYTHELGVVRTFTVTDLDASDIPNLVLECSSGCDGSNFTVDNTAKTLTYDTKTTQGTKTLTLTLTDGCLTTTTTATIILLNERPVFTNLPASISVNEAASSETTLHTIATTDASGDTVTCSMDAVSPNTGNAKFSVSGNKILHGLNPVFDHGIAKYYDIKIACSDGENTVYSNFQVDIIKNTPPAYNAGSGYLPASVAVSRTVQTIYTLSLTDTEGDGLTYAKQACSQDTCDITVTGTSVDVTSELAEGAYDVTIRVTDGRFNTVDRVLSVLVSEDSSTFNSAPVFTNLGATKHVMENTAVGTFIYVLMYTDKNWGDTLTLSNTGNTNSALTYFDFDAATGKVTIRANIDFEGITTPMTLTFQVSDGTDTATGTLTLVIENVNETPTITIGTAAITIDEGVTYDLFTDPSLGYTDPDTTLSADTVTWSMDCFTDDQYFDLNTVTLRVFLAREYDMDSGLSGTAVCTVTVTDAGGLTSSGNLTLTVNNINDHTPKFPYHNYAFIVPTKTVFFTEVKNLTAFDYDSNSFGSTNGILTYSFDPTSAGDYFQIDADGILYVREISSFSSGSSYEFKTLATDAGTPTANTGTTTITIIFPDDAVVTTTTTERYYVFGEEHTNHVWLFIVILAVIFILVLIVFMVWNDPKVHDWITLKLFKISELCRDKPREPKRTVGKLTVMVNNKTLENDPDNALPWELLAKDADVPEINKVQERIEKRKGMKDSDYKDVTGLAVFEKGKGPRPASGRDEVHSSGSSQSSDSAKYATAPVEREGITNMGLISEDSDAEFGSNQWGNLATNHARRPSVPIIVTPVDGAHSDLPEARDVTFSNWN